MAVTSAHALAPQPGARETALVPLFPIASGGMAEVHLVLRDDGHFRRLFALKRLHAHLQDDSSVRKMFLDEARVAGLLRHPNVVEVLDVGEDERGPFLLMPYVPGLSLAELMDRLRERGKRLPLPLTLHIVRAIADALAAAHSLCAHDGTWLNLVHRDVSPHNVLLDHQGAVQLTDFGVAKALGRLQKTAAGLFKGKLGYMSPEQLRYEDPDPRSDLFSLGVILHELLSAERLYDENGPLPPPQRILHEPAPPPNAPDAPPELLALVNALLAKDPHERPASAAEVSQRLSDIAARVTSPHTLQGFLHAEFAADQHAHDQRIADAIANLNSRVPPTVVPSPRWRSPARVVVSALLLVFLLAGGAVWIWAGARSGAPINMEAQPLPPPAPRPAATVPEPAVPALEPPPRSPTVNVEPKPDKRAARPPRVPEPKKKGFPTWRWE